MTDFFYKNKAIKHHLASALLCAYRLLRISNFTPSGEIVRQNTTDSEAFVSSCQLKQHVSSLAASCPACLRVVRMKLKQLKNAHLPLAFRSADGHFILLAGIDEHWALLQYADTAPPVTVARTHLAELWTGVCLLCKPVRFDVRWFIPAFFRYRGHLVHVLLLSVALQLLALVSPLFFQVVMDKVLVHQALMTLDVLVITLLVVSVSEGVMRCLRDYLLNHTMGRIDIQLGCKLVEHVLKLPLAYFRQRRAGNLVARISELDVLREFISGAALTLCVDMLFTFVLLAVMWQISPALTGTTLTIIPFYLLLAWGITRPLKKRVERVSRHTADRAAFLTETVSSAETIKSLAAEPWCQRIWEEKNHHFAYAGFQGQYVQTLSSQVARLLEKVWSALLIWVGATLVMELQLTTGQLIACSMLSARAMEPIGRLVDLWQQGVRAHVAAKQLSEILNQPAEMGQTDAPLPSLKGAITLEQVVFRYAPGTPAVLNSFSLHIHAGEHTGLVGPSGSGKSTIARLLQGLCTAESGTICIDRLPLASFSPTGLRRRVAVVMQESFLFTGSVRDNIAWCQPGAPLEKIIRAASLAGAHQFILALPLGYDTILSEGGASLSGGQRQRIALARALLTEPHILILDEATSALDNETQWHIQNNMDKITAERTVITIAHRLSTVRRCHSIAVIAQGQVQECASHDVLLARGGLYASLWQQQNGYASLSRGGA